MDAGAHPRIDPQDVVRRLAEVRERIAAAGDADRVRIVAVTKGFGVDAVEAAVATGLPDCGENYAQELLAKAPAAPPEVRWHLLGAPQRNKVAGLAPVVALWQAVGRLAVVERLARVAPGASLLVQVDVVGAPGRAGCPPAEVAGIVERGRDLDLDVRGLMVVGPEGDPEGT
ncbi:MAG: alanine racemase, partial [Acidimicrobiales bacterium]